MKTRSVSKTPLVAALDKIKTEIRKSTRSIVLDTSLKDLEKLLLDAENQKNNGNDDEDDDGKHEEELKRTREIIAVLSYENQTLKKNKDDTIAGLRETVKTNERDRNALHNVIQENKRRINEYETQLKEARNFCAQQDKIRTSYKISVLNNLLLLKTMLLPRFIRPECIASFSASYDGFCRSFA
jgi:chromosome segregation ATPase